MKAWRALFVAATTACVLAACGGGGGEREFAPEGDKGSTPPPVVGVGMPASIELTKSAPTISSDGRQSVRLFAVVKDAGNVALASVPVAFSASGSGTSLTLVRASTDANGSAEASLSIDDPTNRVITVTATAGTRSATTDIAVVGTTAAISGPASIVVNAPASFQVVVKDASGEPVANAPVTVSSANGNAIALASPTTNALGAAQFTLTAAALTADTLTATAAGATGTRSVLVSSTLVEFLLPAEGKEIVVGGAAEPIQVRVLESSVPVVGATVTFTATRGTLAGTTTTNASGTASSTLQSTIAGRSVITATTPNGTVATREVRFIADRAARLEVQASPSTVGVNLAGSRAQSSQIIAVVRDSVNNPVKGARVNFSAVDPSAGDGLSQGFAITDETGQATVTFYPGALPTGTNQIVVTGVVDCSALGACAAVPATDLTDTIHLTAARRALQVRIGTGNQILKVPDPVAPVYNEMPYGVLVTDSSGNPVSGVTLNATVVSLGFNKGQWKRVPCATGEPCWAWELHASCPSEDVNENLVLDPGEDTNGDGVLAPGNVALAYFGASGLSVTGLTDVNGSSVMRIRYLRDRSNLADVRLRVSAAVPDGTEGFETVQFLLPVLGSDLTDKAVPPPGAVSPNLDTTGGMTLQGLYGYGTACDARFPLTP